MTITILTYIIAALVAIILVWMLSIERRLRKFFAGKDARSLESLMTDICEKMENLKNTQEEINKHLLVVDKRLDKSIRKVETVRFNPFVDAGSNQSFAISLINDEGDGVVLSSLYARDRMSIFAKPINKGKSEFELSTEEKEVLKKSK